MNCQVCNKWNDDKMTLVTPDFSLELCSECLIDFTNDKYDKLIKKMKK